MSMSRKKCCVPGCMDSGNSSQTLHLFPNPSKYRARFNQWITAIGGDIIGLDNEDIFKRRSVCHAHFEEKYCCRYNRLSNIAVPTLNLPSMPETYNPPIASICNLAAEINAPPNLSTSKDETLLVQSDPLGEGMTIDLAVAQNPLTHNSPITSPCNLEAEVYEPDITSTNKDETLPDQTDQLSKDVGASEIKKRTICRICLVDNVRMHLVSNRNLQEVYEKLTDTSFVTEDSRPMLACSFCYTKLKQCWQLQRKCLEAEEMFAQMVNEDYEYTYEYFGGFIKTPIVHIDIGDMCKEESAAIIEELPDVCETNVDEQNDGTAVVNRATTEDNMMTSKELNDGHTTPKLSRLTNRIPYNVVKHYECHICQRSFRARHYLRLHMRIHTCKNRFKCELCQRSSTKEDKFKRDICQHTGEKPYKCEICLRSFSDRNNLEKHIRTHTGEKPYKCDICQRSFAQSASLKIHLRTHYGENPYKYCATCKRGFIQIDNLKRHICQPTGGKLYKCDQCWRSFPNKSKFKNHIRTHTGEKPYKCDKCWRSFSHKNNLIIHIRTHTGEKPYECNICQRSFTQSYSLKIHIRTHTGEKPYKCEICHRSFAVKKTLLTHNKRIHT